ncbi:hypothetical protein [Vibrio cincinnatiensis]|uniref:hypothetical protein n=1 Tax=Vibrio cincinnatiensis TaxID=675 RepID=UPI001EDFFAF4|nr:hypothetical protein [Vibrio cincinnatiensis]MCG3737795.1 hypothetical protein [Vibrio cincinnatiensis]
MNQIFIGSPHLLKHLRTDEYTIDIDDLSKWSAHWLDSEFPDDIWKFKNLKTPLNFNAMFKNGERLTNRKYLSLLNTIKKVIFLKRSGHLANLKGSLTSRSNTQYRLGRVLISFAQYLVNNNLYIENQGFSGLTKSIFDELVMTYIKGGRDAVSGHLDIVENNLRGLQGNGCLPQVLDKKGYFNLKNFVSITDIDEEIASKLTSISKDSLKIYCLFKEHAKSVLGNKTEFNNATPLKETRQQKSKKKVSDTAISDLVSTANTLSNFKIALKDTELKNFSAFHASTKDYEGYYYESRRTPDIPTDIALSYIDSAIEFVHMHGANLVTTLDDCVQQINYEKSKRHKPRKDHISPHIKIIKNSTTEHFMVTRYNAISTRFDIRDKRETVSLEILIEVFQSAVFILLATFACKRFQDVMPVKQAANTIGYTGINNIKFGLSKADPIEILTAVGRPVPQVVADAFDNLVKINNLLLKTPDIQSNHLFQNQLLFNSNLEPVNEAQITREVLIRRLIVFADFLQIPTVKIGNIESRWYLNRVHMLRRFFACAYYHTNNKKNLPALTWLMGHASTEQTMRYVTKNLTNAEMISSETASVISSAIATGDSEDLVQKLSELFGERSMKISTAQDERRLERRIKELIQQGYRFVRTISGEFTLLHLGINEENKDDI